MKYGKKSRKKAAAKRADLEAKQIALVNRYTFAILGLILLLHLFVYFAFYLRESRDIEKQAIERSRILADELTSSINENSSHFQGNENERLENIVSLMRMSRFARNESQATFRFVAENPLNHENAPEQNESSAINIFRDERHKSEHFTFELLEENPRIHYYRPLFSHPECKNCHEERRFADGELRGVVSISLPMQEALNRSAEKKRFYIWSCVTLILAVSLVVLSLAMQLGRQIRTSYRIEEESSQSDPLTGLPTRTFILERLRQESNRALRHDTPLSAALVCIDHLGAINNRYGQKAGDHVLLEFSYLCVGNLRDYDMVGRYGGEEFLVVLPFTRLEAARDVAERLRSDIEKLPINFKGKSIKVTVSAGVAQWRGRDESVDQLLHRLGIAQYNAQANGRNRVEADDVV